VVVNIHRNSGQPSPRYAVFVRKLASSSQFTKAALSAGRKAMNARPAARPGSSRPRSVVCRRIVVMVVNAREVDYSLCFGGVFPGRDAAC
jgi:hypothetical protein